jgi:hypothetical protein
MKDHFESKVGLVTFCWKEGFNHLQWSSQKGPFQVVQRSLSVGNVHFLSKRVIFGRKESSLVGKGHFLSERSHLSSVQSARCNISAFGFNLSKILVIQSL